VIALIRAFVSFSEPADFPACVSLQGSVELPPVLKQLKHLTILDYSI